MAMSTTADLQSHQGQIPPAAIILLVGQDESSTDLILQALKQGGYDVLLASDGYQVLKVLPPVQLKINTTVLPKWAE